MRGTWPDASGVDRIVAAVTLVDEAWYWTREVVGDDLLNMFLPRDDDWLAGVGSTSSGARDVAMRVL